MLWKTQATGRLGIDNLALVAATDALTALAHRLEHWGAVVEVQAFDIEVGVGRALELVDARL